MATCSRTQIGAPENRSHAAAGGHAFDSVMIELFAGMKWGHWLTLITRGNQLRESAADLSRGKYKNWFIPSMMP